MTTDPTLEPLNRLVGTWTTDATHPAYPAGVVHGTAVIDWLDGERFLINTIVEDTTPRRMTVILNWKGPGKK